MSTSRQRSVRNHDSKDVFVCAFVFTRVHVEDVLPDMRARACAYEFS